MPAGFVAPLSFYAHPSPLQSRVGLKDLPASPSGTSKTTARSLANNEVHPGTNGREVRTLPPMGRGAAPRAPPRANALVRRPLRRQEPSPTEAT